MSLTNTLREKFFHGLVWNGFSYAVYKVSFVILTFVLYKVLSINKFSSWALTNSVIFLLLLWLDCGMRKAIPRYSPIFARNDIFHRYFVRGIIAFQVLLLIFVGMPLLLIFLKKSLPGYYFFILWRYATLLFLTEGMVAIFRLIYHAHFLQHYFNLMYTGSVILEMCANFFTFYTFCSQKKILLQIFINKIVLGCCVIIGAFAMLNVVYITKIKQREQNNDSLNYLPLLTSFFKHSLMMWTFTIAKSLSERNFLLLFLTNFLGPLAAHLFKLSNDAAILFQRIIIKTIGVNDTSLLAYTEESNTSKAHFRAAFGTLTKSIFLLCLPVLPFIIIALIRLSFFTQEALVVPIFIIFIVGYLIEIVLSPYERVLETKRDYAMLGLGHAFYLIILFMAVILLIHKKTSLIIFLALVQVSRVISTLIIARIAHKKYLCRKN